MFGTVTADPVSVCFANFNRLCGSHMTSIKKIKNTPFILTSIIT